MAYYEDLSPYEYHYFKPDGRTVNVGWLDWEHPFNQGAVDSAILSRIGDLCKRPMNLMRGYQECVRCPDLPIVEAVGRSREVITLGDGEIRVAGHHKTYACPTLIYHYILRHGYKPPQEFLDAIQALRPHPDAKKGARFSWLPFSNR